MSFIHAGLNLRQNEFFCRRFKNRPYTGQGLQCRIKGETFDKTIIDRTLPLNPSISGFTPTKPVETSQAIASEGRSLGLLLQRQDDGL
jgi:hypothetical protein